jgi:membrane protein
MPFHLYAFIRFVFHTANESQYRQSAGALTYTTLFALVPMMTVSYVVLSFMPQLQALSGQIEQLIFDNLVPASGGLVREYLSDFSSQARDLTVPGIAILVITALMMLRTVEATFNQIWDVENNRRGVASFLLYWAVLSIGPLLAGAALMLSTYLMSIEMISEVQQMQVVKPFMHVVPFLLMSAALCLIYIAVPNCKVKVLHALLGAVVASAGFEIASAAFTLAISYTNFAVIYGAFAAVPLFLFWIYLCWNIVLFGAVVVRSFSIYRQRQHSQYPDFLSALIVLHALWHKQHVRQGDGHHHLEPEDIERLVGRIGLGQWQFIRDALKGADYINTTADGNLVLVRDLHTVSAHQLANEFGAGYLKVPANVSRELQGQPWYGEIEKRMESIEQQTYISLDLPLADLYIQGMEEK